MNKTEVMETLLTKVYRPLDLGGMRDDLTGVVWQCWCNPPRIIELIRRDDLEGYAGERRTVAILFDLPLAQVEQMDDAPLLWLYTQGLDLYWQYHEQIKKKPASSTPTSTPSEIATP